MRTKEGRGRERRQKLRWRGARGVIKPAAAPSCTTTHGLKSADFRISSAYDVTLSRVHLLALQAHDETRMRSRARNS